MPPIWGWVPVTWITVAAWTAVGFALFGFAAVIYVGLRFLMMALSMDYHLLKEFQLARQQQNHPWFKQKNESTVHTDGGFDPHTDEDAWTAEMTARAMRGEISEEELANFLKNASTAGETKENG